MEFSELIQARRSVRSYSGGIPHDDLAAILAAAQQAPSWKNKQTARCYAVESPETVRLVRENTLPDFNRNSSDHAALIVSTFVRSRSGFTQGTPDNEVGDGWGAYDLGLRDAYLILAAKDAGYDTLIMGIRDAGAIRAILSIPEDEQIMSVIAIGKRDGEPLVRPRKAPEEVVRYF